MSVVVVTGGGTGIGAAVARALAARGDQVVVCGRRRGPLDAVAADTGATVVVGDTATDEGVAHVVEEVLAQHGALDGLVLNAGVAQTGTLTTLTRQDWDETLRINLTGPYLLVREALPHLLSSRGAVVAVGSVAGLRASADYLAYGASKAALHMLVQNLAVDLGPQGVRVNCVAPGWVRTEMGDEEMAAFGGPLGLDVEQAYARVTAAVPQRRPADAAEVAAVVAWLLSGEASYVHGAVLPVDGGTVVVDPGAFAFL